MFFTRDVHPFGISLKYATASELTGAKKQRTGAARTPGVMKSRGHAQEK
jgi:hypothetical protein